MLSITTTEFEKDFDKYSELGQKEEIQVTKDGKDIFKIVPEKIYLSNEAKSFFNILPSDATIGIDPDERG